MDFKEGDKIKVGERPGTVAGECFDEGLICVWFDDRPQDKKNLIHNIVRRNNVVTTDRQNTAER